MRICTPLSNNFSLTIHFHHAHYFGCIFFQLVSSLLFYLHVDDHVPGGASSLPPSSLSPALPAPSPPTAEASQEESLAMLGSNNELGISVGPSITAGDISILKSRGSGCGRDELLTLSASSVDEVQSFTRSGGGMDWAVVAIWSCEVSCDLGVKGGQAAEEFIFVQDLDFMRRSFTSGGINNSVVDDISDLNDGERFMLRKNGKHGGYGIKSKKKNLKKR